MAQAVLKWLSRLAIRLLVKPVFGAPLPVAARRRWMSLLTVVDRPPAGTELESVELHGIPVLHLRPAASSARERRPAILYAHGGGFILGAARDYVGLIGHLAAAAGAEVYAPDYRRAPEHPYPAAVDDLFAVWRALLEDGRDPGRTAIVGDSAGGALAVCTTLAIAEMDLPGPAALALLSPVTDLALSGESVATKARIDPVLTRRFLVEGYRGYAGELALADPRISPLYAELSDLPPTLIQVGEDEMVLDDSVRFADRAWAAGVDVELQRFPGWWHDFQAQAPMLRPAREAVGDIGAFLRRRWATEVGAARLRSASRD